MSNYHIYDTKVASYLGGGQIGKLVGPSDYTIYGLTNTRCRIRTPIYRTPIYIVPQDTGLSSLLSYYNSFTLDQG